MFVLNKVGSDNEKFILLPSKSIHTIGRLSNDLVLAEDLSISRTHARLHLPSAEGENLRVEDLGSKFGTFLNKSIATNKKMVSNSMAVLKVGDKVRFGALTNIWQVSQMSFQTVSSALTYTENLELERLLQQLNGSVALSWSEKCTHLTMKDVQITVKLLHALLDNKPIVNFKYWQELVKAAQRQHIQEPLPDPAKFTPRPNGDIDISWRPERTKIFSGLTFVFLHRTHFDMYGSVVQKAGGACKDLNSGVRKAFLTRKNVIVVQYVPSTQSQATETISNIESILQGANLRLIPEYEIGMAIVICSTTKHCNPSYKIVDELLPPTESMATTEEGTGNSSIIVPSTVDNNSESQSTNKQSEFVVAESEAFPLTKTNTAKSQATNDESALAATTLKSTTQDNSRKRSHNIFVDSSSEDESQQLTKKAKPQIVAKKPNQPINKQEEEPLSSPRRSSRGKSTAAKPQPILQIDNENEDTEELFQFNTKTPNEESHNISSSRRYTGQSTKPIAVGKISVRNFLEKSQRLGDTTTASVGAASQSPQSQAPKRKRVRLEVLNESDCDDGDLFDFGDSKKSKKSNSFVDNDDSNDDEADGLFNFTPATTTKTSKNTKRKEESDDIITEVSTVVCPKSDKKSKYVELKPLDTSRKINISGWLSCNQRSDIKEEPASSDSHALKSPQKSDLEDVIKKEIDNDNSEDGDDVEKRLEHALWLASIKDCIQVRMCALNITSNRGVDQTDHATHQKYNGRENFKKFVKVRVEHPQSRILELKRLQLADGLLTSI